MKFNKICPQAVRVGEEFHDNDWPAPEPLVDWHWAEMDAQCNPNRAKANEPSALSEGLHTVLDVVGMIPVVANAAICTTGRALAGSIYSRKRQVKVS